MAVFAVLSSLLFLLDPMAAAADAPKVRRGTHPALGIYFMLKLLLGALIFFPVTQNIFFATVPQHVFH
jgi:hypothetical protein